MITSSDRDSVNNAMYTLDERNTKLLSAVERAVSANPDNFAKFLGILDNIVTYKPIVAKGKRTDMAEIMARVSCTIEMHADVPC